VSVLLPERSPPTSTQGRLPTREEVVVVVTPREHQPGSPLPDDDPTGVRALLGSLPDPGPMPDDLVARITASIAAEREHRADVRHLAPRRRPLWRTVGIAAAAAVVLGLGGASLLSNTPAADVAGLLSSNGNDSSAGAGRDTSAEGAPSPSNGARGSGRIVVTVHHSERAYSTAAFAGQATDMLASPGAPMSPGAAESPSLGPIATEQGVLSCLAALTDETFSQVTADLGTFDGAPAAVLVVTTGTGHTAYAVQRHCTSGTPALLSGPTPVG
jgi:hypothetical protein